MTLKLVRDTAIDSTFAFSIQPFGTRTLSNGEVFDFDDFWKRKLVPTFKNHGLELGRADVIYGQGDVQDTAWHGIQRGAVVLVDFTDQRPNCAQEFGLAAALGKRMIVITQDPEDIPSDVQGHFRYIKYGSSYGEIDRLIEELDKEIPAALEQPASEMIFVPMPGVGGSTTFLSGKVIHAERDYVMVQTDDGQRVVLSGEDVDYRRIIKNMASRYPVGSRLQGAFEIDMAGRSRYTLLAGQTNPWPALERNFPAGTPFMGTVDSVLPGVGVFVHVANGVNGLVPESRLGGRVVTAGDRVAVEAANVDTTGRKITLRLTGVVPAEHAVRPKATVTQRQEAEVGQVFDTDIAAIQPEGEGGYILVRAEGHQSAMMLHCTTMSQQLRADLNAGELKVGDSLFVEVIRVDGRKIQVKDRPDLEEEEEALVPAA